MDGSDTNPVTGNLQGLVYVAAKLRATGPVRIGVLMVFVRAIETGSTQFGNPFEPQKWLGIPPEVANVVSFVEVGGKPSALVCAEVETVGTPMGPFDTLTA